MIENNQYSYLESLNPQQKEAVVYKDGPSLVIAGAGSGKTRVLTYKIVDLIRNGFEPYRILALTFTNKAANEMKERIKAVVGQNIGDKIKMGTFHSVFLQILRRHTELLGYKPGFTIYDTADSKSLVKIIIKELGLDEKVYKPSTILSIISNAKNGMVQAEQYIQDRDNYEADRRAHRPLTGQIFKMYSERCKISNAMDFDDILVNMNLLLRDHPDIRRHYQDFFRYILVDEYQDTNFAQHLIVSLLLNEKQNLCVVGDDAQSIYSFRGADINNILTLGNKLKNLRIFKLERNYRSTQNIIDAAGSLIQKNTRQMQKNVYSENQKGEPIEIIRTYSDIEEAFLVANMISKSKLSVHDSYDDYAILYRTNAQSRVLEESLRKRNIPYRIYGGLSFYQRKEVKDMIAYFRLSVNPDDDESLRRIINFPARGIGETTLKKLTSLATKNESSIWNVIENVNLKENGFNSGTIQKIANFHNLITEFITDNNSGTNAFELGQLIFNRTGVLTLLHSENTPESISKQENLSEVLSGLKDFVETKLQSGESDIDMRAFLSEVMLATDQDMKDSEDIPKVSMMTVHAAKGLEFNHVYVVGLEEDLFPSSLSKDSLANIEEERRLLYVAITRARQTCTLTYAGSRYRNGQTNITIPSRFLSDISPKYLRLNESRNLNYDSPYSVNPVSRYSARTTTKYKIGSSNKKHELNQNSYTLYDIHINQRILHDRFGEGEIMEINNVSGELILTVEFKHLGTKKLLLRFAKFTILD